MQHSRILLAALSTLAIPGAASAADQTLADLPPVIQTAAPVMNPTPTAYAPQAPVRVAAADMAPGPVAINRIAPGPGITKPTQCWRPCSRSEVMYCRPAPNSEWPQGCWIQRSDMAPIVPARYEYFDATGTIRYREGAAPYAGPTSTKPTWQEARRPNPSCAEVPRDVNYVLVQPTQGGGIEGCEHPKDPSGFEKFTGLVALGLAGYAISKDYYPGYYGSGYYQSSAVAMSRGGTPLTYGGAPRR